MSSLEGMSSLIIYFLVNIALIFFEPELQNKQINQHIIIHAGLFYHIK